MKISVKQFIRNEVIKNLLSAHKRTADEGKMSELICLSKFLLKLGKQIGNETFYFWLEEANDGAE